MLKCVIPSMLALATLATPSAHGAPGDKDPGNADLEGVQALKATGNVPVCSQLLGSLHSKMASYGSCGGLGNREDRKCRSALRSFRRDVDKNLKGKVFTAPALVGGRWNATTNTFDLDLQISACGDEVFDPSSPHGEKHGEKHGEQVTRFVDAFPKVCTKGDFQYLCGPSFSRHLKLDATRGAALAAAGFPENGSAVVEFEIDGFANKEVARSFDKGWKKNPTGDRYLRIHVTAVSLKTVDGEVVPLPLRR